MVISNRATALADFSAIPGPDSTLSDIKSLFGTIERAPGFLAGECFQCAISNVKCFISAKLTEVSKPKALNILMDDSQEIYRKSDKYI
jgi:hypothetical protein